MRKTALCMLATGALVALGGCGDDTAEPAGTTQPTSPDATTAPAAEVVDLTIAVGTVEVPGAVIAVLRVDGGSAVGTGFLAGGAAATAAAALADPAALGRLIDGPATDVACTEQYGGPDVAHISGTIGETTVDTTIDRANGCGIADWDLLQALLPAPLWSGAGTADGAVYGDAEHPVLRSVGGRFTVRLESNPTTGYEWQATVPAEPIVELVGDVYEAPDTDLVGAGGAQVFEFDATAIGVGVVEFAYLRSFEEGVEPVEARSVHVEVSAIEG